MIYDCTTKLLAVQNNRNSIGANGVSVFIEKLCKKRISMSILTYADGYDEILSDDKVEYKSLVLGFTKLSELKKLATEEDDNIKKINEITSNIGALGGKIEFNVGRSRSTFLDKVGINNIVKTLKGFKGNTTLKLKIIQGDCVRTIDLISDKVCSTGIIFVSKEDPKTFDKIISTMQEKFEEALTNELEYCKKISDIIVV